jgi:hypothetical protein
MSSSFTKQAIRKEKGMTMTSIKRIALSLQSRLLACFTLVVFGLGKTFQNKHHPHQTKRRGTKKICLIRKKAKISTILKKGQ